MSGQVPRRVAYALIVILLVNLGLFVTGLWFAGRKASEAAASAEAANAASAQRLCAIMLTLDGAYRGAPPTTETGRNLAKSIHDYVIVADCVKITGTPEPALSPAASASSR